MISTPPNTHAEPALAALERGLHVFVEKPMALTRADAQRMVEAACAVALTEVAYCSAAEGRIINVEVA